MENIRVLVVRRGFGGHSKFRYSNLESVVKTAFHGELMMPEEYEVDLNYYVKIIESFQPDIIVAMSSGCTLITSLLTHAKDIFKGIFWVIGARNVESWNTLNENLKIYFSHGTEDNLAYMEQVILPNLPNSSLHVYNGAHNGEGLFEYDDTIKDCLTNCWNLHKKEIIQTKTKKPIGGLLGVLNSIKSLEKQ